MGDNQRQIVRNEETVVQGEPEQTTVSESTTTDAAAAPVVTGAPYIAAAPAVSQGSARTTTTSEAPGSQVVSHNYAENVVDPAADKVAGVNWFNNFIWFVVGVLSILLVIRFVLLAAGANENVGFAQLIYGLTGWMVSPFSGLFGTPLTYPGTSGTGVLEYQSLIAFVVLVLVGWLITRIAELALGTNRTTGTVYSDTERRTKL